MSESGTAPLHSVCVELGWSMQSLLLMSSEREGPAQTTAGPAVEKPAVEKPAVEKPAVEKPAVEKPAVEKPAPPLIALTDHAPLGITDEVTICLRIARRCVKRLEAELGWGTAVSTALGDADSPATPGDAAALAISAHKVIMVAVTGSGDTYGRAYLLGVELCALTRDNQTPDEIGLSFAPDRLLDIHRYLNDLASLLPDHAAKSVNHSLTWWRDVVYLRDKTAHGEANRQAVKVRQGRAKLGMRAVRSDAPGVRRGFLRDPKIGRAKAPGDKIGKGGAIEPVLDAVNRQGELWKVVLTGQKKAEDLLAPDDYVALGRRATAAARRVALTAFQAAPVILSAAVGILTAVLAAALVAIHSADATDGGKLAATFAAVGAYAVSFAKAVWPRVMSWAKTDRNPLWEEALDYVAAEAMSLIPVGAKDPAGWGAVAARFETNAAQPDVTRSAPADAQVARSGGGRHEGAG